MIIINIMIRIIMLIMDIMIRIILLIINISETSLAEHSCYKHCHWFFTHINL